MTATWVLPDQLFDGEHLHRDKVLMIDADRVIRMVAMAEVPNGADIMRIAGTVSPGFIDLQVNGGGGVLFNQTPTPDAIATIARVHRQQGSVAIMPTVITDVHEVISAAADAVIAVYEHSDIAGVHIEGPHIAENRCGTHKRQFIRPMDNATVAIIERLCAAGVKTMMTVAPEIVTTAQISNLVRIGAIVSLGHTNATAEQMHAAFAAGATCVTHLYNAMSPMANRAPGAVGAAINSTAFTGIICDGHHVADDMVGLAIRARPEAQKMFLVSDAMPTVSGPDRFDLYGQTIALNNGRLVNAEHSLAGAHVTMAQSVARLVSTVGVSEEVALQMAVTVPARVLGQMELTNIVGRSSNDLLVLGNNLEFMGILRDAL